MSAAAAERIAYVPRQARLAGVYAAGGELLHRLQGPAVGGTDSVNWIKRYGLFYARVISLKLLTR
jgi:hypothetical protein